MPNNTLNSPRKPNPTYTKNWLSSFNLLMTIVKSLVFAICMILLYTFFGDSFNFQKVPIQQVSRSSSRPNIQEEDWDKIENGIHVTSGLIYADNFEIVRGNCTACHSGRLVAQNRATREGWQQMIRWMQETQGLWDLGANEPKILDYLATHYAPEEVGRRQNIDIAAVEWYILDLDNNNSTK